MMVLIAGLMASGAFLVRLIYNNLKQRNLNIQIAEQLQEVTLSLEAEEKAQKNTGIFDTEYLNDFQAEQLSSPAMLSTILTVLVYKYKTLRITMNDFMAVPDDEYISVYVDSKKQDLVLSSNHNLATENPITMINFTDSDDTTFH